MRAEFIRLEIIGGNNTNKLIRRDGPSRRMPVDCELLGMLLRAKANGLKIDLRRI